MLNFLKQTYLKETLKDYRESVLGNKKTSKLIVLFEILFPWILINLTIQFFLKGNYSWVKFITIPLILAFIIMVNRKYKVSYFNQGLKPKSWKKPILYLLIPGAAIGIAVFFIGLYNGTISKRLPVLLRIHITVMGYPIWGMIQQYTLLVFLLPRLNYFIKNPYLLIFIMGLVFSLTHLPNAFLVIITFPASVLFLFYFLNFKNIYVQGYVHGFVGAIMKFSLPTHITLKFWIGNLISWNDFINYFN